MPSDALCERRSGRSPDTIFGFRPFEHPRGIPLIVNCFASTLYDLDQELLDLSYVAPSYLKTFKFLRRSLRPTVSQHRHDLPDTELIFFVRVVQVNVSYIIGVKSLRLLGFSNSIRISVKLGRVDVPSAGQPDAAADEPQPP
jgi:hypothetical protein